MSALYVHIPFCQHICAYCDFPKVFYHPQWADEYLKCLEKELHDRNANHSFDTVYIGGGSPSALNEAQLKRLFTILQVPLQSAKEKTIEVNPEDLDEAKIALMKEACINRVSIGVQTFDETLLERLGRNHNQAMINKTVKLFEKHGITNLSFDFIYGLPSQTMESLANDLAQLQSYPILKHVSFYTLILEEHTRFYQEQIKQKSDDWLLTAQQMIIEKMAMLGFERYEVSNFAKKGYQSQHNLVYWHNENYVGIGCGASGYLGQVRYDNTRSLNHYLNGQTTSNTILLTPEDQMFESMMLGLRLTCGISLIEFFQKHHQSLTDVYGQKLTPYLKANLLIYENGYLKTTPKGLDVLDEILVSLM